MTAQLRAPAGHHEFLCGLAPRPTGSCGGWSSAARAGTTGMPRWYL